MAGATELIIPTEVVIATTTFYLDNDEGRLRSKITLEGAETVLGLDYKLVVVDGSPDKGFARSLEDLGACVLEEDRSLEGKHGTGRSRRQAFDFAYENFEQEAIAWAEPEKLKRYGRELWKTAVPILNGEADLVIPDRGELLDYPIDQQHAEHFANIFFHKLTGHKLDVWGGPRTWRRDCTKYFTGYKGDYGDLWDSTFIPIIDMIKDGKKVVSVPIDYHHPKDQTEMEEGDIRFIYKRGEQIINLFPALKARWDDS